ncbi:MULTISPECIES: glycosyltransferase family 4 protein [unclassified Streptococcus]|uniref:glycosyltransferase family 4 protein n=1 Tax=unclassified Streptococcus TaxID=2608887 RepID=UPI001071BD35|nr:MULTISPECIES: glycosyltransferase family 4 protein [unclassified Streptococcus]MBF0786782.1 glycosyltransferase family 4 protein [Streptococcus sp. 19428wC2_LYSM12]MCQ9211021.1 glycosyltransferase family 4 protein [Streptococcus sp. B01]MCQ9214296.1 glycosyltransferase family 4 protein [Streptococcus sp. O1]TFV06323.1 glycosyltransferase [Streptococcus sp. LYSM12]
MKVLLYLEGKTVLEKSGIGRALHHQMEALDLAGIPYTTDLLGDYDVVHINTYGPRSWLLLQAAKRQGKKVILHGHSTMEDFRNSFIGSNLLAPFVGKYLASMYQQADFVITPSEYSKKLIQGYGVTTPIVAVSNGIDLNKYQTDPRKEEIFRKHFDLAADQPVVVCAGLYFRRKGIEDFVKVAERMPHVRFIWLGSVNKWIIPAYIRKIVEGAHPANVSFPGYFKGAVFQGAMSGADAFFFPSYEETEGIVVLEALASRQQVVLRNIPVYEGWIDENSAELGDTVDDFVASIQKILDKQVDKREAGYQVAESRSIDKVSHQLADAYRQVMEL